MIVVDHDGVGDLGGLGDDVENHGGVGYHVAVEDNGSVGDHGGVVDHG